MARGDGKVKKSTSGEKPGPDIYSGLLFVSFAALVTSCVVLFLQLKWNYGGF